jgi:cell division protein FtsL
MMQRAIRKFTESVDFQSIGFKRLRSHRYFPIGAVTAAVLILACFHVWQRVQVITLVSDVAVLRERNRDLTDHLHKMQYDIAALSMATRIEAYAVDTLGMQPIVADRLYTLVRDRDRDVPRDELATMFSSIKRIADCLPVITETRAQAAQSQPVRLDSALGRGAGQ